MFFLLWLWVKLFNCDFLFLRNVYGSLKQQFLLDRNDQNSMKSELVTTSSKASGKFPKISLFYLEIFLKMGRFQYQILDL